MITRRHFLVSSFPLTLSACTTHDAFRLAESVARGSSLESIVTSHAQSKAKGWVANPDSLKSDVKRFERFLSSISDTWGDRDGIRATPKEYVKYTDSYINRARINFETGLVTVESLDSLLLKKAIVTTLLTPFNPKRVDLFSDKEVPLGDVPFLFNQLTDNEGKPVRWEWRAERFAQYLVDKKLQSRKIVDVSGKHKKLVFVEFPLVDKHSVNRKFKYSAYVERFASQYDLESALVYAVIKTESNFNPYAVSWVPAYGLMQIVPTTAGRDAFEFIHGYPGTPSSAYLFNIENNIRMGCAYLYLLNTRYLAKVRNIRSKEYCVIAAYNGGAGNVLRSFSSSNDEAFKKINRLSPEQVWAILRSKMPSESRSYLVKVVEAKKKYS